jgi:Fe2+ transport system protein FeoA
MECPLCGYTFDETQMACHASCAFNQSCGIICCPNCGYQIPDERKSRLAAALRNTLTKRKKLPASGKCPLSQLQAGQSGLVIDVNTANHARAERLQVLGITPGARITLEQKQPAFVLQVGFTEISIERAIADEIMVDAEA